MAVSNQRLEFLLLVVIAMVALHSLAAAISTLHKGHFNRQCEPIAVGNLKPGDYARPGESP